MIPLRTGHWTIEPQSFMCSGMLFIMSYGGIQENRQNGKMAKSLFHPALCREKSLEKSKPQRHRASVRGLIGPESMAASGKRPIATSLNIWWHGSPWGQMAMPPPHPFEWRLSANVAEPEEGKRLATRLAATDGSLISPLRHWRVAGFAACWAPKVLLVWETYKNPWGVGQPTSWNTNDFEMDAGMPKFLIFFSKSLNNNGLSKLSTHHLPPAPGRLRLHPITYQLVLQWTMEKPGQTSKIPQAPYIST